MQKISLSSPTQGAAPKQRAANSKKMSNDDNIEDEFLDTVSNQKEGETDRNKETPIPENDPPDLKMEVIEENELFPEKENDASPEKEKSDTCSEKEKEDTSHEEEENRESASTSNSVRKKQSPINIPPFVEKWANDLHNMQKKQAKVVLPKLQDVKEGSTIKTMSLEKFKAYTAKKKVVPIKSGPIWEMRTLPKTPIPLEELKKAPPKSKVQVFKMEPLKGNKRRKLKLLPIVPAYTPNVPYPQEEEETPAVTTEELSLGMNVLITEVRSKEDPVSNLGSMIDSAIARRANEPEPPQPPRSIRQVNIPGVKNVDSMFEPQTTLERVEDKITGKKCCVVDCYAKSDWENCHFRKFPADRALRAKWIKKLKAESVNGPKWVHSHNDLICDYHFAKRCHVVYGLKSSYKASKLKAGSQPTIFFDMYGTFTEAANGESLKRKSDSPSNPKTKAQKTEEDSETSGNTTKGVANDHNDYMDPAEGKGKGEKQKPNPTTDSKTKNLSWNEVMYIDVNTPSETATVFLNNTPSDFHLLEMENKKLKKQVAELKQTLLKYQGKGSDENRVRRGAFDYKAICEDILNPDQIRYVHYKLKKGEDFRKFKTSVHWTPETLALAQELRGSFGTKSYEFMLEKLKVPLPTTRSMVRSNFYMPPGKGYYTKHPDQEKFRMEIEKIRLQQRKEATEQKHKDKKGPMEAVTVNGILDNLEQIFEEPEEEEDEEYRALINMELPSAGAKNKPEKKSKKSEAKKTPVPVNFIDDSDDELDIIPSSSKTREIVPQEEINEAATAAQSMLPRDEDIQELMELEDMGWTNKKETTTQLKFEVEVEEDDL